MKRDPYIDIVRGAAAVSVVAIHTACKSGASYVPGWFLSLTLLLDVPVFFFLSGWSLNRRPGQPGRTFKSLFWMWLKWAAFISLLAAGCRIIGLDGARSAKEWFEALFFRVTFRSLPVVNESVWFFPEYIRVLLLCQSVLYLIGLGTAAEKRDNTYVLFFGVLLAAYAGLNAKYELIPLVGQQTAFYAMVWMAGMLTGRRDVRIRTPKGLLAVFAVCVAGYFLSQRALDTARYVQDIKFPPKIPYLFVSSMSIACILYLRGRVQGTCWFSRMLAHIGRNALFYFMAQGVTSSLLSRLLPFFGWKIWFAQWLVFFALNLLGTAALAEMMAWSWQKAENLCSRIHRKNVLP